MGLLHTTSEPLLPPALIGALLVPPLFYLHSGLLPALSTWCLNQDCGRNITKRRAIHHQGCPGYEIQAGPYQQWLLSCMLDLMLVYLSPKQLHNVWFIEQSCWYKMLTTSLGSGPVSLSMIILHTPFFPNALTEGCAVCFFPPFFFPLLLSFPLSHCCCPYESVSISLMS